MPTPIISADPQTGQPMVANDIDPNTAITSLVGDAGTAISKLFVDNIADVESTRANVLRWGFVGDRTTNNSSAFDDLIAYLKTLTVRPAIYFPAGFYLFGTQPKFDIPGIKVIGDGRNASFLVGDNGVLFNYPQPTIHDIGITPEAAESSSTGLELRNCWQASLKNVLVGGFAKRVHVTLTDEGEELIPGNGPGSFVVPQFTAHSQWPHMDEFVRDSLTTTEHWGSRVTLASLEDLHFTQRTSTGDVGLHLENTLSDPTADYTDFDSLSGSSGQGVFFTGINIQGGNFQCRQTNLHIGGGVATVKINDTYMDCDQEGIRLDYGARKLSIKDVSLDFGGKYAIDWEPDTDYVTDDVVRIADRQYTCTTGGKSAASTEYNGVPNSEFVGAEQSHRPVIVAGTKATGEQLAQAQLYGLDFSSGDVEVYIEGITVTDGKRWLNLATNLPTATGFTETANIWFGNTSRALSMPAVSGDQLFAKFSIQHRDPRIPMQPSVTARIRCADGSSFTVQSTGVDILSLDGFTNGHAVDYTENYTIPGGSPGIDTTNASPYLSITYSSSQSGWFPFRVSCPQINAGVSLGSYVKTTGRRRASSAVGPSGTGTGIAEGPDTLVWDYSGTPIAAIIAPRQAWDVQGSNTDTEIRITGSSGVNQPLPGVNPLPHYYCMTKNPINSNSHPTTIPD